MKTGIDKQEYEKIYEIYRAVRDKKRVRARIEILAVEKLLYLLEKEIEKYDKKKKEA